MSEKKLPPNVLEFFRKKGSEGGKKRAANHSKKQLAEWGKLGGRPRADGGKKDQKGKKRK